VGVCEKISGCETGAVHSLLLLPSGTSTRRVHHVRHAEGAITPCRGGDHSQNLLMMMMSHDYDCCKVLCADIFVRDCCKVLCLLFC